MKRNLLKTLLAAVCLLVGQSVWAETETVALMTTIDYSTTSTPAWTVQGGTVVTTTGAAVHSNGNGGGSRTAYLDFGVSENIDDNWTVEFDAAIVPGGNKNDQQITVAGAKTTYTKNTSCTGAMYLGIKQEASNTATYTIIIGTTSVATGVALTSGTTYHIKVTYDGTSAVTATIGGNQYNGTAAIADVGVLRGINSCVARYNGQVTYDNIAATKEVEAGSVEVPTASITAVNGVNRTVTFACATDGVTFSYSTDGGSNFTEANYLVISENTDIIVKATKGTKSAQSETLNFEAGTEITLNTPTWTKTAYNSGTGVSTVTLASDQSDKLLNPTATIYYAIDGGAATAYSSAIEVADGAVLTYYATATGYTNSAEGSVTAVAPSSNPTLWTETYNGIVSENSDFSLGNVVIAEINGTKYYNLYYNSGATLVSDNLLANNVASNYMMRANGLYCAGSWNIAILGLEAGDYITITGVYGNGAFSITGNTTDLTTDTWNSIAGSTYCFTVKNSGTVRLTMARYGYLQSIKIQRATVSGTITDAGWSSFSSTYPLDLSSISGGTAYYASAASGKSVTLTETTATVPAGEGLMIKGTAGATFTIPVAASGTAIDGNLLKGQTTTSDVAASTEGTYHYVFGFVTETPTTFGFYNLASATSVAAGKSYLETTSALGARANIILEDEVVTGINAIENVEKSSQVKKYLKNGRLVIENANGTFSVDGARIK